MAAYRRSVTSRSSKCIHPFNLNFGDEINKQCVAEAEVRELNTYSKKALQTSYNEIDCLKQKCQDQRKCIAELEAKVESMKSQILKYKKNGDDLFDAEPSSDSMNYGTSSSRKSEETRNGNVSSQKSQLSIPILKLPFRVPMPRNSEVDTKIRSLSCKVTKSRKSFRKSFIRRPPSALQVSLRKQQEAMERQKHNIVEGLLLRRNQKKFAEDTLMRTIELNSQTLQMLMHKHQEEKYSRSSILHESIRRFNAIQRQEHEIEARISRKLENVEILEQVVRLLKSRKD